MKIYIKIKFEIYQFEIAMGILLNIHTYTYMYTNTHATPINHKEKNIYTEITNKKISKISRSKSKITKNLNKCSKQKK